MLGKTHVAFSLGLGSLGVWSFSALGNILPSGQELVMFYSALAFGSLFLDIDEPNSTLGKNTIGISNLIKILFGHRGLTHSLIFLIVMGCLLRSGLYVESFIKHETLEILIFGFLLGCSFHLIGDMLTLSGVPLLFPFSTKRFHLSPAFLRFKTGGIWDYALGLLGLVCFGWIHFNDIRSIL